VSKTTMTVAFTALMAASAPLAFAQSGTAMTPHTPGTMSPHSTAPATPATSTTGDSSTMAAPMTTAANHIQPDQVRASKLIGSTVYDVKNRNIGDVKDLILDRDGRVAQVVLDVGAFLGMGGKYVAVSMSDIKTDNNRLTLDRSKEELQQAQAYRLTDRSTGAGTSVSPVGGGHLGAGGSTATTPTTTPVAPKH
jgi:sporulation protein YlmC with PRC-barrel domain